MAQITGVGPAVVKPVVHAGTASQDRIFKSGTANSGVIREGAPVAFDAATGGIKEFVVGVLGTATGITAGTVTSPILLLGIALNSTTAASQDCLVALAYPGRRFVCTMGGGASGTDDGTKALALADVGQFYIFKIDAGTYSTVSGPTKRWLVYSPDAAVTTVANNVVVTALIDAVGSSTGTAVNPPFGGIGGSGSTAPPNTTWQADPATSKSSQARVEIAFLNGVGLF